MALTKQKDTAYGVSVKSNYHIISKIVINPVDGSGTFTMDSFSNLQAIDATPLESRSYSVPEGVFSLAAMEASDPIKIAETWLKSTIPFFLDAV